MSHKRFIGGLASASAAAWAALCAAVYIRSFGHIDTHDENERLPNPGDFGLKYEVLPIETSDGVQLLGWYIPGRRNAVVVVSGGYRGKAWDVIGMTVALRKAGYHVVMYGWRGTPGSDQNAHTLGVAERKDLMAVIASIRKRLGTIPVGLLGYSMGGAVSLVAAADPDIFAVCADSAFSDPVTLISQRIRRTLKLPSRPLVGPVLSVLKRKTGENLKDFSPLRVISHIAPRPLFLIHGEADTAVPVSDAVQLYTAALNPKSLWILPATIHVGAYFSHRKEYVERVISFFNAALEGKYWNIVDIPSSVNIDGTSPSVPHPITAGMPASVPIHL